MAWKAYNAILDDPKLLVFDSRPLRAYLERHIRGSINVKAASNGKSLEWVAGPGPPTWSQDCWWGRNVLVVSSVYSSESQMRKDLRKKSEGGRMRKRSRQSEGKDVDAVLEFMTNEGRTKSLRILESENDEKDSFAGFAKRYPFLVTRSHKGAVVSGYPAEIIPRLLYLGDLEHARNEMHLDDLQITHVLTIHTEPLDLSKRFLTLFCELADESKADITQFFERMFEFVEDARRDKKRVLVHCGAGASRSATLCASYLMRVNQWKAETTLKFLREQRRQVDPNPGFTAALVNYEKALLYASEKDTHTDQIHGYLHQRLQPFETEVEVEVKEHSDGSKRQRSDFDLAENLPMLVFDILKEGTVLGTLELVEHKVLVCGRGANCDVVLDHASISRQHAKLEYVRSLGATVMDLGSIHGTFINNVRLQRDQKQQLYVGDVLTFGASTRRYVLRS